MSVQPDHTRVAGSRAAGGKFRWGFGVSLALHGAAVAGLLLMHRALTPDTTVTPVQLVMLPAQPEGEPSAASPPAEPPDSPLAQAAPEPAPPPVAAAEPMLEPPPPAQPLPDPPPGPPPKPVARPPARVVAARPRPALIPAASPHDPTVEAASIAPAAPPVPAPARPDPAWLTGVSQWLLAHRSYPDMARRLGRQGTVVVRITVDPDGHVRDVTLVQGSGSESLDQAAEALVRNAQLPPFPSDMNLPRQSVTLPIRYRLE